jgi:sugar O-acyltransferase (sialic acid O-acetyltransferase NeuD family)
MGLRILGAGGHAKVALEAWRSAGQDVIALHDDRPDLLGGHVLGVLIAGTVEEAIATEDALHIAIGDNGARARVAAQVEGDRFPIVVHARALVSPSAEIGPGVLVCAGAVVQAEGIGRHTIVNTQALVEHDVEIGEFSHVAPGVRLGGAVRIGEGAFVGIGAVVLPGIRIGVNAVVGAGAVVIRDVPDSVVVVGNPARRIRST